MSDKPHRETIFLEDAEVLRQEAFPAEQFVIEVRAPECASAALAGQFAHVTCDPAVPMRRPLSIMRADAAAGTLEFLYKIVGDGLRHLAARQPGDRISVLGPIGRPFETHAERSRPLLLGGGVGIPPMVFLAEALTRDRRASWQPLVLMGSEVPFPFPTAPSRLGVPGMPAEAVFGMPFMEHLDVPSRLTSLQGYEGCYRGYITDLARAWLASLSSAELARVEIFACGPTPMLKASAVLAREFGLPCQVSLEEFMACAVGGCAGCTVEVATPQGPAMKRVCVDGPVFSAYEVYPEAS